MRHARADYNGRIEDNARLIPDDEPVFLLRGQDQFAAAAVLNYADLVERAGGDPNIVALSRQHAADMLAWPKKKLPDLPEVVFSPGDVVEKTGGDYTFRGVVVAAFNKRDGQARYVVEDDRGLLLIHSNRTLTRVRSEDDDG